MIEETMNISILHEGGVRFLSCLKTRASATPALQRNVKKIYQWLGGSGNHINVDAPEIYILNQTTFCIKE